MENQKQPTTIIQRTLKMCGEIRDVTRSCGYADDIKISEHITPNMLLAFITRYTSNTFVYHPECINYVYICDNTYTFQEECFRVIGVAHQSEITENIVYPQTTYYVFPAHFTIYESYRWLLERYVHIMLPQKLEMKMNFKLTSILTFRDVLMAICFTKKLNKIIEESSNISS